ncbi:glycosyltransferase family 2 protein [Desulfococcaceae bacterium HSG9]|nr:glycosyltransferase family 2 protein [Desulfococcaceae bacterium HSG9]
MNVLDQYYGDLDLTLFVACYNEEDNIIETLHTLLSALKTVDCSYDIIIIDDGSTDNSVELIRTFQQKNPDLPIILKVNKENEGLAQNYIEAAFLGRGKYYRLICGDNVEPKETFVTIFKHLGESDMIIPYQVECPGRTFFRRLLSRVYTNLINFISGYSIKYYNGLAVHLRYNVMRWHTNYRGFGFQADMITRLLDEDIQYIEIPVVAKEREAGTSTALKMNNLFSVAHTLLDLSIRRIGRSF